MVVFQDTSQILMQFKATHSYTSWGWNQIYENSRTQGYSESKSISTQRIQVGFSSGTVQSINAFGLEEHEVQHCLALGWTQGKLHQHVVSQGVWGSHLVPYGSHATSGELFEGCATPHRYWLTAKLVMLEDAGKFFTAHQWGAQGTSGWCICQSWCSSVFHKTLNSKFLLVDKVAH